MPSVASPLSGWVVADLSSGIAGGYCTKILCDGGADVIKLEPPEGDPLRAWSASGAATPDGGDGALFSYLSGSKQSVVPEGDNDVHDLLARADVAVWSPGPGPAGRFAPDAIRDHHPHLTVTAITPFGLEGPWRDRPATEFTLQAWSGAMIGLGRGNPDRAPVYVGGQIGAWLAGAYAAVGTLVARAQGGGGLVDVSILEALALCLTYYPVTFFDATGRPFRGRRSVVTPGVGQAKDGMIAVGVGTGQQWLDFCVMVGHPEWMEDRSLFRERSHLAPAIDQWFSEHTVAEIRDMASAFRLPNAPIANGANLPELEQFAARGTFVRNPRDGFLQPAPPYRMHPACLRPAGPAPRLGEHRDVGPVDPAMAAGPPDGGPADVRPAVAAGPERTELPFAGLRVLDMTAFWAGPSCTHPLAMLGAEVIHLESTTRLDGTRMLGAPMTDEQWWEKSPIFAGINTNKKSLALDFQTPRGMALLRRLIATCDVVVENYTPRVLDQAGLTFDAVRAIRADVIMVRMPGFGLDGPWRDNAAFAYTIEDASGLTWLTGYADQNPLEPYCVGDPNAGIHALAGLLLALEHRRRTGEGVGVEAAMVDAAVNVTAEQVVEFSAYGTLLGRAGNRGPAGAPQNVYRTADADERGGNDSWVAIAVSTDAEWNALTTSLGDPAWAGPELATADGRARHHDLIDEHLAAWCGHRSGEDIVDALWPAGVAVAKVTQPHRQAELAQLEARRFFESVEHPVLGAARYSTLPIRFSAGPHAMHARPAPLLGEHNREVLAGLGLSDAEIGELEHDGVIGRVPSNGSTR